MKKVIFAAATVIGFLGILIPAANAAAGQLRIEAKPGQSLGAAPRGVMQSVTCPPRYVLTIAGNGEQSYNTANHDLWFTDDRPATTYCIQGSRGEYRFVQNQTSRCLYIVSSANKYVTEGPCADTNAHWNVIDVTNTDYALLENDYNGACIEYGGSNSTATYDPCNSGNVKERLLQAGLP